MSGQKDESFNAISPLEATGMFDSISCNVFDLPYTREVSDESSILCRIVYSTKAESPCLGSFLLPDIVRRNPDNIADFRTQTYVPFSYLFDQEHFLQTLKQHCPRLRVFRTVQEMKIRFAARLPLHLDPLDLPTVATSGGETMTNPDVFRPEFEKWINRTLQEPHRGLPLNIHLGKKTIWTWPTAHDPPEFVRNFGRLIRFNPDVRRLAGVAVYNLKTKFKLPPSFQPINGLDYGTTAFVGAHVRAEKDAKEYLFLHSYDLQLACYKSLLAQVDFSTVVYVATGEQQVRDKFAKDIEPYRTTSKQELLDGNDLLLMSSLSWDQQALIDMLILERASYFMGTRDSTFSWTLAMHRAAAVNWVVGGYPQAPCTVRFHGVLKRRGCYEDLTELEFWRDDLSVITGNRTSDGARGMHESMARCIWP
jgi:hypothetical protein